MNNMNSNKPEHDAVDHDPARDQTIFENTGTATCILEADGTISKANKRFAELAGYPVSEIINKKTWMEFVIKEDLERMRVYHAERRQDGKNAPERYEFDFKDAGGDIHRIDLTVSTIPGTQQSVASLNDITEQVQLRERYKNIFEHSNVGLCIVGENDKISMANQHLADMLANERENIIGAPLDEVRCRG